MNQNVCTVVQIDLLYFKQYLYKLTQALGLRNNCNLNANKLGLDFLKVTQFLTIVQMSVPKKHQMYDFVTVGN